MTQTVLPLEGGIMAEPPATEFVVHDASPLSIIQSMVERGIDPREMIDLHNRMQDRAAEQLFALSMHRAQQEMPAVVRDAENPKTHSRFALLETIQKKAKPIYSKHGFSLSFGEADCPLPDHKRTICDCTHVAGHTRQYHLDLPVDGVGSKGNPIGGMNAVQGAISTGSYAQRRLTCMIFNITIAGEDDDGNPESRVPISDEQYATLEDMINASGADRKRFLSCYQVEKLGDLPRTKFDDALAALRRKMAQKK